MTLCASVSVGKPDRALSVTTSRRGLAVSRGVKTSHRSSWAARVLAPLLVFYENP